MMNQQMGLGAMTAQPYSQPALQSTQGMSAGNMAQLSALAKELSDQQLAAVLQGKSSSIPQILAMQELQSRQSLRTAAQGQQAQQQAASPSIKDQTLAANNNGISALPAGNLGEEGMAHGGIIAFAKGEDVVDTKKTTGPFGHTYGEIRKAKETGVSLTDESTWGPSYGDIRKKQAAEDAAVAQRMGLGNTPDLSASYGSLGIDPSTLQGATGEQYSPQVAPPTNYTTPSVANSVTPQMPTNALEPTPVANTGIASPTATAGLGAIAPTDTESPTPPKAQDNRAAPVQEGFMPDTVSKASAKTATPTAGLPAALASKTTPKPAAPMGPAQHPDYYAGMDKDTTAEQISQRKEQAQGEFLMQMGAGLLSNPNLAMGLAAGVKAGLPGLAENRKQIEALQQHQKEYQLNLAKAKEARDSGNDQLAFHYAKQAQDNEYQMGKLAVDRAQVGATAGHNQAMMQHYADTLAENQRQFGITHSPDMLIKQAKIQAANHVFSGMAAYDKDFTRPKDAASRGAYMAQLQQEAANIYGVPLGAPMATGPQFVSAPPQGANVLR